MPLDDPLVRSRRVVAAFSALAIVVTLLADSVSVASSRFNRLDLLYYGRYTEAVCMPALVIGAGWMLTGRAKRVVQACALVGIGIVVAAIAVPVLVPTRPANATLEGINVVGVYAIRLAFGVKSMTLTLVIAALVGTAVVLGTRLWNRVVGVAVLVVVLAAGSLAIHRRFERDSKVRATEGVLGHVVSRLGGYGVPTGCIGFDRDADGVRELEQLQLPLPVAGDAVPEPRRPVAKSVRTADDLERADVRHHASVGASLSRSRTTCRCRCGSTSPRSPPRCATRATGSGLFFPGSPCAPLPSDADPRRADGLGAEPRLDPGRPRRVAARDRRRAPGCGRALVGDARAIAKVSGCGRVEIATSVSDAHGKVVYRHTIPTPRSLLPGEREHVVSGVVAPGGAAPKLTAGGPYTLKVILVQEGVRFFGGTDQQGVSIPLGSG